MSDFRPEHEVALRRISGLEMAPDGSSVVYCVEENDPVRNARSTRLWGVPLPGGQAAPLSPGTGDERLPCISPDGQFVAYVSTAGGVDRLMVIPSHGGFPERVLDSERDGFVPGDIYGGRGFCWAPDSRRIAVLVQQGGAMPGELSVEGPRPTGDPVVQTEITERLRGGPPVRLCILDTVTGEIETIGQADRPLSSLSWSPEGSSVLAATREITGYGHPDAFRIVKFPRPAAEQTQLEFTGSALTFALAPDGQRLAVSAAANSTNAPSPTLFVTLMAGNDRRYLTGDDLTSFHDVSWTASGRTLYAIADRGVERRIVEIDIDSGTMRDRTGEGLWIERLSTDASGRAIAFAASTPDDPGDVWVLFDDHAPRRLTAINPSAQEYAFGTGQPIAWEASDGKVIEGVLIVPAMLPAHTTVPLVLHYHGGPAYHIGLGWRGQHQLWAAAGFAVLAPNFRGSTGYGSAFSEELRGDIGGKPFTDCLSGVDHVISEGIANPDRLVVYGHSWGGYKTNWTITQTDRFRAAVSSGSVANLLSVYGTRYSADVWEWRLHGTPWESPEQYLRWSPIRYAQHVKTPTLFLNGLDDRTTPPSQGLEMFTALRKHGIAAQYIGYPREGHLISEPAHRIDREHRILEWFRSYISTS